MKLIQGDCIEVMKTLDDNSVDLVVTSPPYDNLREYNNNMEWTEKVWKDVIGGLERIVKPGGVIVWVVGDATIGGSETGTSFRQALYFMERGFKLHDTMIWNKGSFSAVGSLSVRYAPVFEYMFIFSNGRIKTFNPIKDRKTLHPGVKTFGTIRQPDGSTKRMSKVITTKRFSQRYNIWDIPPQRQSGDNVHPAPFPIAIPHDHIVSWSNHGDVVLDPFMGSGTTGMACRQTGRDFIGIELDERYFEIAEKRIASVKQEELI